MVQRLSIVIWKTTSSAPINHAVQPIHCLSIGSWYVGTLATQSPACDLNLPYQLVLPTVFASKGIDSHRVVLARLKHITALHHQLRSHTAMSAIRRSAISPSSSNTPIVSTNKRWVK